MTMPIAPQHHFTLINGIRTHYVTAENSTRADGCPAGDFPKAGTPGAMLSLAGRALSCHRPRTYPDRVIPIVPSEGMTPTPSPAMFMNC